MGNSTTGPEAAVRDTASSVEKRKLPIILGIVAVAFQGVNGKVDGKPDGFGYTAELGKAGANRVADSTPVG
tara:strand:- start:312 stop:524 length:213 start_codon:yes stop_codon:yes gene_type:complete